MEVFLNIILLAFGMILLIKGADFFVDGSSSIAKALKVPSLIIGLTLVSIGTSAPELSVSITSALNKANDLSFGNIVGSNIFNVLIVVGLSSIITPLVVSKEVQRKDIPILLGIYLVLIILGFIISPLKLELWESLIIFSLFFVYTGYLIIRGIKEAKQNKTSEESEEQESSSKKLTLILGLVGIGFGILTLVLQLIDASNKALSTFDILSLVFSYLAYFIFIGMMVFKAINKKEKAKPQSNLLIWVRNLFFVVIGLVGIVLGGTIVVDSASFVAVKCGMDQVLVGLTIVAIGTSLPELVTSIIAARKGENDIALGNAIGSCIFNVILILGLSSTIYPLTFTWDGLVDVIVMTGAVVVCLITTLKTHKINRIEGLIMVAFYIGYTTYIIARNYM